MWNLLSIAVVMAIAVSGANAKEFRSVSVFSPLDVGAIADNIKNLKNNHDAADIVFGNAFREILNPDVLQGSSRESAIAQGLNETLVPSALVPPNGVVRRNVLHQNGSQLDAVFSAAEQDSEVVPVLAFDLFNDVHIKVVVNDVTKTSDGSTAVSGYVQGMPGTFASLTKTGGDIYGTIKTYDKTYVLNPTSTTFTEVKGGTGASGVNPSAVFDTFGGVNQSNTVIDETNPALPEIEEPPATRPTAKPPSGAANDVNPTTFDSNAGDDPSKPAPAAIINFAVFYTQAALDKAGGVGGMNALINASISSLRVSFLTSQININVNVTYQGLLDYTETGNIQADRDALQAHTDSKLAPVPVLKSKAKANIVALIVENGGPYCGVSYIPEEPGLSYQDFSYIVVARSCAVQNYSFAHETGHVLGARHDMYVDATEGKPLGKNHGIMFKCGQNYCRDIMAYPNYCEVVLHIPQKSLPEKCNRVALWSGKVWTAGAPVPENSNDTDENTQRALRIFGPIVSGYK